LKGQIYVSAATPEDVPRVEARVTELLRERHHLSPGDENDFYIRNQAEIMAGRAAATATITTLLAAIAGVSLVVGGIGVMNIMLVSVVERTREIGIRMAIGARPVDVLVQFLVESIVLSAVGGAIGLGVGAFAATKLSEALGSGMSFPSETAVVAVAVSGGVGILFGLYPAVKASRLDPIQALRVET
jgi:putative ABC transport system permease protein